MHSQCCADITFVQVQTIPSPQRNPIPLSSHPSPSPSPIPTPQVHALCLWIGLFWTFPISGITHWVSFCVWLLSLSIVFLGSIHIVVSVEVSPLYVAE